MAGDRALPPRVGTASVVESSADHSQSSKLAHMQERSRCPTVDVEDCYHALSGNARLAGEQPHALGIKHQGGGVNAIAWWQANRALASETFPPFLVAGLGMVAAGILLGAVKTLPVYIEVNELLILVPPLLGLKGNLEMTLASRLSTHANLGLLDECGPFCRIAVGNLAVVQCQAAVVGCLAAVVAFCLDFITTGAFHPRHILLMASASVAAASTASLLLASLMIFIVMASRRLGVDPDNIASPIAGMLGDFCTLGLLSAIAHFLWEMRDDYWWMQWALIVTYSFIAPVCARFASANPYTSGTLREGWKPVIISMLISSGGGLILSRADKVYKMLAPFAPVMNGAGGNLAAVQTSRISTDLHSMGTPGRMPMRRPSSRNSFSDDGDMPEEPLTPKPTFSGLLSANTHSGSARVLISLAVPGAVCFVTLIVHVQSGGQALPQPLFLLVYVAATLVQVSVLFVAAHGIVGNLWCDGLNPDNAAIPYVTSLGDLVGTTCLTVAFWVLTSLGGAPWTIA